MKNNLNFLGDDLSNFKKQPDGWDASLRHDVASIILDQMKKRGLTRSQVAEMAGMKAPQLTRVLHGYQNVTSKVITRILHAVLFDIGSVVKLVEIPALTVFNCGSRNFEGVINDNGKKEKREYQGSVGPSEPISGKLSTTNGVAFNQPDNKSGFITCNTQPTNAAAVGGHG